jgi:hypothetical protein
MLKTTTGSILLVFLLLLPGHGNSFSAMAGQPSDTSANQASPITGTVIETMTAGGYTYVCVESGGQRQWVAIPATEVRTGEVVELAAGSVMHNFTSKSLNKTFDTIILSGGLMQ